MQNVDQIKKAWRLASKYHKGQTYGGQEQDEKVEYLEHIGSVMLETQNAALQDVSIDGQLAMLCAILHDILEDTECDPDYVKQSFGLDVYEGILALTKNENLPSKEEMMKDSLARINQTKREVAIVKMADRICNLNAPPYYWTIEKMITYVGEAKLILKELKIHSDYMAKRLAGKIRKYEIDFIGR